MKSCVHIPNKRNSNDASQLFEDLNKITKDRDVTKVLWGLAQNDEFLKENNLAVGVEPTALQLLKSFEQKDLKSVLGPTGYVNYINTIEELDKLSYKSYNTANSKVEELIEKYQDLTPIVSVNEGNYNISLVHKTKDTVKTTAKQQTLKAINDQLTAYMEKLGFGVSEIENLDSAGKFSPLNAVENGDNLINIIQISKGFEGQEALPEEFSHFIVEGFSNNPLLKRLNRLLDNEEIVKAALGEEYEHYNNLYNGNKELLKKEVAAKLIAQNIVNREGIEDSIKYISDRFLDVVQKIFSKGDVSYIQNLLDDIDSTIEEIVNTLYSENFIKYFDRNALMNAPELHRIIQKGKNSETLANEALELMAKRLKILSVNRRDGKMTKEETKAFNKLSLQIDKKKYKASILSFLNYCLDDINDVYEMLERFDESLEAGKVMNLKGVAKNLRKVEVTLEAYGGIIAELAASSKNKALIEELEEEDITEIGDLAGEILLTLNELEKHKDEMRLAILVEFYKKYWTGDKTIKNPDGTETKITLRDVMEGTVGDTNSMGRFVNAMSDMPDIFLALTDVAYKDAANNRDSAIMELQQRLGAIQNRLREKTGSNDTSFMYVKDTEGKPTGMLVSDIDYQKYYAEKHKYAEELKKTEDDPEVRVKLLNQWKLKHTEVVKYPNGYSERMPKKSMYSSDALSKLNEAQREYYDAVMDIKSKLDRLLPQNRVHRDRAIQKRIDSRDAILQGKNIKTVYNSVKDRFVTNVDDTEYGETVSNNGKYVVLDFAGNPVKKIPVYYTSWLDDMSMLDTNFTDCLLSYGAMAFNKNAMDEIVDFMELASSQNKVRKITQTEGEKKLHARFKLGDKAFDSEYIKLGENSELQKVLDHYIEKNVYGQQKAVETKEILGYNVNYGKILDWFRQYTSVVGLGFNWISGTVNDVVGLLQIIYNSGSGDYTFKDLMKAHKEYIKMLPEYMMEQTSNIKKSKLSLLIQKFDILEDYFSQLDSSEYCNGVFKKIITKISPLIPQSMGEHHLRSVGMLAILNHIKVTKNNQEMSLLDALEVEEYESSDGLTLYRLTDKGSTFENKALDDNYYFKTKLRIQEVNHKSLSNFSDVDKGYLHKYVAGRFLGQFRQWMPKFYMERFKSKRYNAQTDRFEEGYYNTYFKFIGGLLKDAIHLKFELSTRWDNLSEEDRKNILRAIKETSTMFSLGLVLKYAGEPDKEDPGLLKYLSLVAHRTYTDITAGIPSLQMVESIFTIIKSPVAAVNSLDTIINLLDVHLMFDEIENGRFEGWSRWAKNLYYAIPTVKNMDRLYQMLFKGDTSLFLPYID